MPDLDPQQQRSFAVEIVRRLGDAGHIAYWAGGCVRDQRLGHVPKDYDVATDATPDEIRELFGRRRTIPIGAAFGVITVLGGPQAGQIEVATFRRDAAYSDGRRPDSVTFSNAEEDARRRDFTINGLFYDPLSDEVVDFVGGQEDLKRGVVRAIGNPEERIAEDKLRMLRAVRFAAAFEFELDEATGKVIAEMAGELPVVSAERIAEEMRKILRDAHRSRGVELLRQTGLLPVILPEGMQPLAEDRWKRTLRFLDHLSEPSFPLALAGLLVELADGDAALAVCRDWKLSNRETERTAWLVRHRDAFSGAGSQFWPKLQRILIHDGAGELIALAEALAAVGVADGADVAFCKQRLDWPAEKLNPPPLLSGDNLLAHGLAAGPEFRQLLERLRDAQLLGEIDTPDAALERVDRWRAQSKEQ